MVSSCSRVSNRTGAESLASLVESAQKLPDGRHRLLPEPRLLCVIILRGKEQPVGVRAILADVAESLLEQTEGLAHLRMVRH